MTFDTENLADAIVWMTGDEMADTISLSPSSLPSYVSDGKIRRLSTRKKTRNRTRGVSLYGLPLASIIAYWNAKGRRSIHHHADDIDDPSIHLVTEAGIDLLDNCHGVDFEYDFNHEDLDLGPSLDVDVGPVSHSCRQVRNLEHRGDFKNRSPKDNHSVMSLEDRLEVVRSYFESDESDLRPKDRQKRLSALEDVLDAGRSKVEQEAFSQIGEAIDRMIESSRDRMASSDDTEEMRRQSIRIDLYEAIKQSLKSI